MSDTSKIEEGTLNSSVALNEITMSLLADRAKDCKRLWIALIISILVNLVTIGGFLWYESTWDTSTETITIEQDTGEGEGNNVYQSGEHANYNESPEGEGDMNG